MTDLFRKTSQAIETVCMLVLYRSIDGRVWWQPGLTNQSLKKMKYLKDVKKQKFPD